MSLLDLHPTSQPHSTSPLLEILEAGTGHGALTLHLARAIHAANVPASEKQADVGSAIGDENSSVVPQPHESENGLVERIGSIADISETGNSSNFVTQRKAIIHSLDISPTYSEHATKIVQGFRRGLYTDDVQFHVGDISAWVETQLAIRQSNNPDAARKAFLSHVFLDLPASHNHATKIASVLRVNGSLIVFAPSITQIVSWVEEIKRKRLPLLMDQVLELGQGISGGRQWDLRAVRPRALLQADGTKAINAGQIGTQDNRDSLSRVADECGDEGAAAEASRVRMDDNFGWEIICRPKVGDRVIGGGFLGVWKKMRQGNI